MSKKQPSGVPDNLPEDFFDFDKKTKKVQEDELAKEMEQFEKEMEALQAESEEQLKDEFEKLQEDKNLEELDQQIDKWKRIIELEKRAEELKNKPMSENPTKRFKVDKVTTTSKFGNKDPFNDIVGPKTMAPDEEDDINLDDIEDFEDKLFDWRSKGL